MNTITLNIKDMHCVNCAMKLQALEDDLPGVSSVDASFRNQRMTVVYDETKVDLEKIVSAVKELGYTPELSKKKTRRPVTDA